MKKNLEQTSVVGRILCVVGLLAIVVGVLELFVGIGNVSSLGRHYRDLEGLMANLQIAASIVTAIAGLLFLAISEIVRCLNEIATAAANPGSAKSDASELPEL